LCITALFLASSSYSPLGCLSASFIGNKYDYITWITIDACLTIIYRCYVLCIFLCQMCTRMTHRPFLDEDMAYMQAEAALSDELEEVLQDEDDASCSITLLGCLARICKAGWVIMGAQVFLTSIEHCSGADPIFVFGWVYLFSDAINCSIYLFYADGWYKEYLIIRQTCCPKNHPSEHLLRPMSSSSTPITLRQ
jgi:hypothetical protein